MQHLDLVLTLCSLASATLYRSRCSAGVLMPPVTDLLGGIAASPHPVDQLCKQLAGYFGLRPNAYQRISLDFKRLDTSYRFDLAEADAKRTRSFEAKARAILDQPDLTPRPASITRRAG